MNRTTRRGALAIAGASVLLATAFMPGTAGADGTNDGHHHRRHRHHHHFVLTAAQKQCLTDQGIDFHWGHQAAGGIKRAPIDLAALRAALTTCGITFPSHDRADDPAPTAPAVAPVAPQVKPSFAPQANGDDGSRGEGGGWGGNNGRSGGYGNGNDGNGFDHGRSQGGDRGGFGGSHGSGGNRGGGGFGR